MTTQNYSEQDDIIVPTNDKFTYRGLDGNDTYILISKSNTSIDIIDTSGSNTIQLPEWSKIKSIIFTSDAVRITCDDMTTFTINGADKFTYDIGGNETNNHSQCYVTSSGTVVGKPECISQTCTLSQTGSIVPCG